MTTNASGEPCPVADELDKLELAICDAATAAGRFDNLRDLYAEVFAEPPHDEGSDEVELFTNRWWPQQLAQPGFRLVTADHPEHGLIGATYGHQLTTDTTWWDGALQPIDDTTERPGRTVAIIEMMVRRPWRRHGIATAMHNAFLEGRAEERCTLLVRPENDRARTAYLRWGYRIIGQIRPARTAPVYDAMIRRSPVTGSV